MKAKFFFATAMFFCAATAFAQPKMTILGLNEADSYNWGTVSASNDPMETTLEIKNDGNEELAITGVKPGCGCTTPVLGKNNLAPGEKTTLKIGLASGNRAQNMMKSLNITSNDPNATSKYIFLKANVVKEIDVQPTYLVFPPQMAINKVEKASVKVLNNSKQDVAFSDFEATNGAKLNVKGKKVVKAGETLEIEVSVTPDKAGVYQTQISMKSSHPDYPAITITGAGNVVAEAPSK